MDPEMESSDQREEAPQQASRLVRPAYTPPSGATAPPFASPPPVGAEPPRVITPPPKAKSSSPIGKIVAVAALAVASYFGYGYLHNAGPTADGSPTQIVHNNMLVAETQSPNYQKNKNASPSTPMHLGAADFNEKATNEAIAAAEQGKPIPGLDSASPELVDAIKKHEVKFITVRAYDSCAEDGDWVTLSTDNGSKIGSFMLTILGKTITIPVVNGQLPAMTLTGDKDGVGGITVGIETSGGTWYSGVLAPGESQPIPLAMQ